MENKRQYNKKGFSLVEIVIVVAILAVLLGVVSIIMGDTVTAAKDNTKKSNAITMNKLMDEVKALGGVVADGSGNDVDTSSVDTIIASLTKNPPLNVNGISFGIKPKPEAKDYKLVIDAGHKQIEANIYKE